MIDKFCGLYVTLEKDECHENIERIRMLIEMIKGVVSVKAKVSDPSHWCAYERAQREIIMKILHAVNPEIRE
jgi:hypothetical protein